MKRFLKISLALGIAVALTATAFHAMQKKKGKLARAPIYAKRPVPVNVVEAKSGVMRKKREYIATVESPKITQITSRVSSIIDDVYFDEGDTVKSGDLLISLDDREIKKEISAMESSIAQKKAELTVSESEIETLAKSVKYWKSEKERERFLLAKEATSKARYAAVEEKFNTFAGELRAAKNKLLSIEKALQACNHRLQKLNIQLSYCKISSPFSGIVTKRSVDPGVLAVPGKHLMTIEDISCRKLVFDIPQQDLSLIKEGNLIVYETDKGKGKATLGHIFPALDKARLCRAEASICHLARKNLKIGMQLPVAVIYASSNDALTLIPVESLIDESKDSAHVYLVDSGKLKRKKVKIWGVDNELAGVKGIEPGESVVTSSYLNWINLSEGLKVETVQ